MKSVLVLPTILILLSLVVAGFFSLVASERPLTVLEGTLLQGLSLLAGLAGSYVFGRQSAKNAARDLIQPHARSAFRRVLALFNSLSRLAQEIERAKNRHVNDASEPTPFDTLEAIVTEQLATAGDALDDWRDIVPEEVQEVESLLRRRRRVPEELEQ